MWANNHESQRKNKRSGIIRQSRATAESNQKDKELQKKSFGHKRNQLQRITKTRTHKIICTEPQEQSPSNLCLSRRQSSNIQSAGDSIARCIKCCTVACAGVVKCVRTNAMVCLLYRVTRHVAMTKVNRWLMVLTTKDASYITVLGIVISVRPISSALLQEGYHLRFKQKH